MFLLFVPYVNLISLTVEVSDHEDEDCGKLELEVTEELSEQFREKQLTPDDLFKDIQEVKEKLAEVRELLQPRNVNLFRNYEENSLFSK